MPNCYCRWNKIAGDRDALSADNDKLRQLYDSLASEHERTSTVNGMMTLNLRTEKLRRREAEDRYLSLRRQAECMVQQQRFGLEPESGQGVASDARYLHDAKTEHLNLRDRTSNC
jgi:hypothetical protein